MTAVVTMKQLLESGVHFGHQTRRWNPKMKRFIFTERNGIYIIDLQQSLDYIDRAYEFIKETVAHGGTILYVGTKKQAQEAIAEQARRVGMPFVNQRWLGGMLTNFGTVFKRLQRLKELEEVDFDDVAGSALTKKELLHLKRERDKLDRSLGGIRHMTRVPSAVWVVDTKKEHIAVSEARKLGIPVIAILDTNCDPDEVTYPIPGNDDAIRSVALLTRVVADAVADGLIARAGAADGEEKPATALGVELGSAEPLAEWERELLPGRPADDTDVTANGAANGAARAEAGTTPAGAGAAAAGATPARADAAAAGVDAAAAGADTAPAGAGTASAEADTAPADTAPAGVAPAATDASSAEAGAGPGGADAAPADSGRAGADGAPADSASAGVDAAPAGAAPTEAVAPQAEAPADAGTPEAGTPEAGTPEAGTPQAGTPQAGTADAGTPEAAAPDAGTPDAGTPEAAAPEAGTADAGTPEAAAPDAGTPDAAAPNAEASPNA